MSRRIKYWLSTRFTGRREAGAFLEALSALRATITLFPRTKRLPPSLVALDESLRSYSPRDGLQVPFELERGRQRARGRIWIPPSMPFAGRSTFEVDFSLQEGTFADLFESASELREVASRVCRALTTPILQVQARDSSPEEEQASYDLFQRIDIDVVPVRLEWITIISLDLAERLGWRHQADELRSHGMFVGESDGVWYVMLTDTPFSYAKGVGSEKQKEAERLLRLADAQHRFPNRQLLMPARPQ